MSFIAFPSDPPPTFPDLSVMGFPIHKKPYFSAWEHKSVLGSQYQTARQVYPNWEFILQYGEESWLREQTQNNPIYTANSPYREFEAISQLFMSCYGSYGEFWYKDASDASRSGQIIATGDATRLSFRVVRTWGVNPTVGLPVQMTEPVGGVDLNLPIAVYVNGSPISSSNYTVTNDLTGSFLTFTYEPTGIITMDFSFFYRCRFKEDMQQYDQWAYNLWQLGKCEFRSVKP